MKTYITKTIRILFLLLSIIGVSNTLFAQGINIQTGATLTCTGNATIQIDNGSFVNNGSYLKGTETITFTGSLVERYLSGSNNTQFNNLVISSSAGVSNQIGLLTVNNLTINNGSKFIIEPVKQVTVNSVVTNNAGNGGLVIKSSSSGTASFISSSVNVPATVERYIENNSAWHFLSSPVLTQEIWPQFTPAPIANSFGNEPFDWDFYYFNPNAENTDEHLPWVNIRKSDGTYNDGSIDAVGDEAGFGLSTPAFTTGRGYLVEYASGYGLTDHQFAGNLNAGSEGIDVIYNITNPYNLVGNPFPSAIDWKASSGWDRTPLYGDDITEGRDFWCWNEAVGNYGTYNSIDADDSGTNGTNRYIAPMQGFFVVTAEDGTITINDDARIHNSQSWLKNAGQEGTLKFNLSSEAMTFYDEIALKVNSSYAETGSFKFWSLYASAPELFFVIDTKKYSVLRSPAIDLNKTLDVGMKIGQSGDYKLSASGIENFESRFVILEDLASNTFQNLSLNPEYFFHSENGDYPIRFKLHFTDENSIDENLNKTDFVVYAAEKDIYILPNSQASQDFRVIISDVIGRTIFKREYSTKEKIKISLKKSSSLVIVNIKSGTKSVSAKLFLCNVNHQHLVITTCKTQ